MKHCFTILVASFLATIVAENPCFIANRLVKGNEIGKTWTNTFAQCREQCSRNDRCIAVNYGIAWPHRTECYLITGGYGRRQHNFFFHLATLPCQDMWKPCAPGYKTTSQYYKYDLVHHGMGPNLCTICPVNKYSHGGRVLSCTDCPRGKYNTRSGSSSCHICPPGTYGPGSGRGCWDCPKGTYTSNSGAHICNVCPANTISTSRSVKCTPCPAGKFSATGSSTCSSCPVGQFGPGAGRGCEICPLNTYSNAPESTRCTRCAKDHISLAGATECLEFPNGAACWIVTDETQSLTDENAQTFEIAQIRCTEDEDCVAVTCRRNASETSTTECFVGNTRGEVVTGGLCKFSKEN